MRKIEAKIVADSVNPQGNRITTFLLTFPRFILSELNTHRVFSKNSASSRAIPFEKMVKMVEEDPFIPIAWQKNHSGMQGTEYLSKTDKYNLVSFIETMSTTLHSMIKGSEEYDKLSKELDEKVEIIETLLTQYTTMTKTLDEWWLFARDKAVEAASIMYVFGVTKQLCNRLLEPFMWHTVLLTGTEFDNFFKLRCPSYDGFSKNGEKVSFRSKKDVRKHFEELKLDTDLVDNQSFESWQSINTSQAEIHMQALAEAMWDAMNESTPKELKAGEWHIPFGDKMQDRDIMQHVKGSFNSRTEVEEAIQKFKIKIAVARCARLSYMTFDGKVDYEKDIKLHDSLLTSHHASPFEHCCRVLTKEEYNILGKMVLHPENGYVFENGWVDNFKGFISYRRILNI